MCLQLALNWANFGLKLDFKADFRMNFEYLAAALLKLEIFSFSILNFKI